MSPHARVCLYDAAPQKVGVLDARLRERGHKPKRVDLTDTSARQPKGLDLAVVLVDADSPVVENVPQLVDRLAESGTASIVWGTPPSGPRARSAMVEWLSPEIGLDELTGKVDTLARYAPLMKALEREVRHLQRLGEQLNRHFGEIDQEMRLAGRLQRDFLPREFPEVPPFHFEVLYRPASWVSGDMYDVFRIDETHLGMFIADAMGHGVAAGLLTMFLRQALVSKHIDGDDYTIVRPAEALENLHQCLVRQQLPNCQFVTAAYAIIDTVTHDVTLARAGHPYAIHIDRAAGPREIVTSGSLLGLPDVPSEFEETELRLNAGDKLVLYTDGMEDDMLVPRTATADESTFTPQMLEWAQRDAQGLTQAVRKHLDRAEGSLNPADDVTLLVLEVGA